MKKSGEYRGTETNDIFTTVLRKYNDLLGGTKRKENKKDIS